MSRYHLAVVSGNAKTGPIATTISSRDTCPAACPLKQNGCYAESWPLRTHWDAVSDGTSKRATDFAGFTRALRKLPRGKLLRHNQAGDLPGNGNRIATRQLTELASAMGHLRAFTYTHKPLTRTNARAIREVNRASERSGRGLVINLSADTLAEADALAATDVGPVVVVLPVDQTTRTTTPQGRTVVVCPAVVNEGVTCESCQLCSHAHRKAIVGFPAHGSAKRRAESATCGRQ